jgi:uncharacterized protein YciI
MTDTPPVRYIILHTPGPAWVQGLDPTQQPGVPEHSAYLARLFKEGKIDTSGPFLKAGAGGMALTTLGVTEAEAERIGREDPGVKCGLINFEVRPWLTVFRQV